MFPQYDKDAVILVLDQQSHCLSRSVFELEQNAGSQLTEAVKTQSENIMIQVLLPAKTWNSLYHLLMYGNLVIPKPEHLYALGHYLMTTGHDNATWKRFGQLLVSDHIIDCFDQSIKLSECSGRILTSAGMALYTPAWENTGEFCVDGVDMGFIVQDKHSAYKDIIQHHVKRMTDLYLFPIVVLVGISKDEEVFWNSTIADLVHDGTKIIVRKVCKKIEDPVKYIEDLANSCDRTSDPIILYW